MEYNFDEDALKNLPKDAANLAKSAAMDDILGPEDSRDGGSLDNSLMEGEVQSGPNYAFVVNIFYFILAKHKFFLLG